MPKQPKPKTHWMNSQERPMILTREQTAQLHFRSRFGERYKTTPTATEIRDIIKGIRLGRTHKLTSYQQGKNLYAVGFRGRIIGVVYNWNLDTLVTILPSDDPRIIALAKQPGQTLKKWLHETKLKEVIPTP